MAKAITLNEWQGWQQLNWPQVSDNRADAPIAQLPKRAELRGLLDSFWACIKRLPFRAIVIIAAAVALLLLCAYVQQHILFAPAAAPDFWAQVSQGFTAWVGDVGGLFSGIAAHISGLWGLMGFAVTLLFTIMTNPLLIAFYIALFIFNEKRDFALIIVLALTLGWNFGALSGLLLSPLLVFALPIWRNSPKLRQAVAGQTQKIWATATNSKTREMLWQTSGKAAARLCAVFKNRGQGGAPKPALIRIPVEG